MVEFHFQTIVWYLAILSSNVTPVPNSFNLPQQQHWMLSDHSGSALESNMSPSGGTNSALHQSLKVWLCHFTPRMGK
jgi:hypothetical protein